MSIRLMHSRLMIVTALTALLTVVASHTFTGEKFPVISKLIVEQTEILSGLNFNDEKRDSMLDGLQNYRTAYENIRSVHVDNAVPPALLFNPVPVKQDGRQIPENVRFREYSGTVLPDNPDDLAFYPIGKLADLLRSRKISSVELTGFFIERLKRFDPMLEAVVTLTEDRALEAAAEADREIAAGKYRGPLQGIPYGAKDLLAVKGYPTTWGATPYRDQYIDVNATVIQKLDDAGAVLVAKLTLGALAWGDVWFGGRTKNPWNIESGSSGSSAGPAAAVSAGLVPFSIGSETWGSIVSPSTVCGVTGLRPSYGRVSRHGAMALSWSMDKIGPICRTAEDCAIVFDAIRGTDGIDQSLFDMPFEYRTDRDLRGRRIGYVRSDFEGEYPFRSQDSLSLIQLAELGAELIPFELPDLPVSALSIILSAEAAAAFDELTRSGRDSLLVRQVKNAWPNVFRQARFIPAVEYLNANRIRYMLIQEMERLFTEHELDLYVAPSWQGNNLLLTNLTGHPCVVVPNGFSDSGTPTSISFTGRLFDEGAVLETARVYQESTGHHLKRPPAIIGAN